MKSRIGGSWLVVTALALGACDGGGSVTDGAADHADVVTAETSDVFDAAMDVATDVSTDSADVALADGGDVVADASDGGDAGACALGRVLVSVSDYMTFGGFVMADLATRTFHSVPAADGGAGVDQDHANRTSGCTSFDLEHSGTGAIATLDPGSILPATATIDLPGIPAEGGTTSDDPDDIAVINSHKAYVAQYNSDHLAIVDPTSHTVTGSIDLHALADSDGIPEMASITLAGGRAYVALQQLDRANLYAVPPHSHIAVIDLATDTLVDVDPTTSGVQGITLTCSNPTAMMPLDAGGQFLLVAEPGDLFTVGDGCLDVIDLRMNAPARTVTNAALGGDPSSVDVITGSTAWTSVDAPANDAGTSAHTIRAFDLGTGNVMSTPIANSTTYQYTNVRRAPDGTVWSIGGDYNAGSIHVFDATSGSEIGSPFTTGSLNTVAIDFVP